MENLTKLLKLNNLFKKKNPTIEHRSTWVEDLEEIMCKNDEDGPVKFD